MNYLRLCHTFYHHFLRPRTIKNRNTITPVVINLNTYQRGSILRTLTYTSTLLTLDS